MKTTAGNSIVIAPIGDFDPQLLTEVGSRIHRVFGCSPLVGAILADVSFAFDAGREQYHSTPILQRLAEASPPGALKVLALTDVDLFIPILTHVYGEAQLGGTACIVSTYRLNSGAGPALLRKQALVAWSRKRFTNWGTPSICATARTPPASCTTAAAKPTWTASPTSCAVTAASCSMMNSSE